MSASMYSFYAYIWAPVIYTPGLVPGPGETVGNKQELLPVSVRALQVLRKQMPFERERGGSWRGGEKLLMGLWRGEGRGEHRVARVSDCSPVLRKFWPGEQGALEVKSCIGGVPHLAGTNRILCWPWSVAGNSPWEARPWCNTVVDADEHSGWGQQSLTLPAAGDLRGYHTAFLAWTVWRGRRALNK